MSGKVVGDVADESFFEYVGFWRRVLASLIDTVLFIAVLAPLALLMSGKAAFDLRPDRALGGGMLDFLLSYIAPAVAVIVFWQTRQATPGKMLIGAKVVDARSGGPLSLGQSVGRYLGYYVSIIPCCLGLLWVAFDARKQGWHDKLAGTLVVRDRR